MAMSLLNIVKNPPPTPHFDECLTEKGRISTVVFSILSPGCSWFPLRNRNLSIERSVIMNIRIRRQIHGDVYTHVLVDIHQPNVEELLKQVIT